MHQPQFLIGATSSGSGKTTFTLGLLRALKKRGMKVQPFKCGPDYLDTKHHAIAAGQPSYNLDTFLASFDHLQEIYARHSQDADVCIIEGVMGLFDGYCQMQGSSAEIADLLHLPVILIVNARSTAYTVAALLYGFKHFQPNIRIAGVIFNFVSSPSHYNHLKRACQDAAVEDLGYLPRCKDIEIPSRHLGLNIDSEFCFDDFADRIAEQMEQTVKIDRLLEICSLQSVKPFVSAQATIPIVSEVQKPIKISVAYDEAFNFIYPENIRTLELLGKLTFFSPLRDKDLPASDLIYLPGGYPEFHLKELSANENMRRAILKYCRQSGHLFAECGGMMYLGKYIADENGKHYPMCDYLPQGATMENMKLQLGYRKIIFNGQEFRGHEFHYSHIAPSSSPLSSVAQVYNAQGEKVGTPVYRQGNVLASYIHFYWGETGILPFFR